MNHGTWVFGYGSLVSPESLARTIGRAVDEHRRIAAHLAGYGRRWNYGSLHLRGDWTHGGRSVEAGVVISLGLTVAASETCNGAIVEVDDDELAALDWRERDYERVDVTDHITLDDPNEPGRGGTPFGGRVVTYVPRPSAVERYEAARDERRAAVRASYWQLVREAFESLGRHHADHYETTPPPDVPVVDISLRPLTR